MLLVLLLFTSAILADGVDAVQYCGKVLTTHVERICRTTRCANDMDGAPKEVAKVASECCVRHCALYDIRRLCCQLSRM